MDKRQTLEYNEALSLVRRYKQVIASRFPTEPRVMLYGSYCKGNANPDSDIDVAVIVPTYGDKKMELLTRVMERYSKREFFDRTSLNGRRYSVTVI